MGVKDKAPKHSFSERVDLVYNSFSVDHVGRYHELRSLLAEVDGRDELHGMECARLFKAALKQLVHASLTVPLGWEGSRGAHGATCVVSVQTVEVQCCSPADRWSGLECCLVAAVQHFHVSCATCKPVQPVHVL